MTTKVTIILIAVLVAYVCSTPSSRAKRQDSNGFLLPDGAELILTSAIDSSFICSDEGYYADVTNNCEIFHVCHITEHADGRDAELRQYSFLCGNQTIFNQFSMTCATREDSLPCEYAPEFFNLNKRVQEGRPDVLLHTDADVERLANYKLPAPNPKRFYYR